MSKNLEKIEELYHRALAKPREERAAFLAEACAGDEALRRELESMLAALEKAGGFMELPALELAARMAGQAGSQLLAGHELGPYRIGPLLGRGGMGEVYRAVDTRLDRPVALKLLPAEVAGNPERLHRFTREAKAASVLNHPHIATIYEIGEAEGWHFIAMEYVEGQTLSERIAVGADPRVRPRAGAHRAAPLPIETILDMGIQVAEALEEAHTKGIIHRDIKPANIMLTPKGQVKVLDFGLAKRVHREMASEGTAASTESHTTPGVIMGTVEYMSPEQVLGQEVDRRTDLFSLGVTLYDLVTGRLPFSGASPTDTMYKILHAEPEAVARFNHGLPAELDRIIRKCLEKDQGLRYQTAPDLCVDLRRLKHDTDIGKLAAEVSKPRRRLSFLWAKAFLLAAILAGTGYWFLRSKEESRMPVPFATNAFNASFSPDGNQVAFVWNGEESGNYDIYIKQVGGDTSRRLTTAPEFDYCPAWSPDGHYIAFIPCFGEDRFAAMMISSNGGMERQIAELRDTQGSPSLGWHPGGKWLAVDSMKDPTDARPGIFLLSAETGEKRRLTSPPRGAKHDMWPAFSPDGRRMAFARIFAAQSSEIFLLSISSESSELLPEGEPRQLTFGSQFIGFPAWMPDGNEIIFDFGNSINYGSLWRIAVSGSHKPKPLPFVAGDVTAFPAVSLEKHRLIYTVVSKSEDIWRGQIQNKKGKLVPTAKYIASTRCKGYVEYSSDGKQVVYVSWDSGSAEIWVCDSDGSHRTQLTHLGGPNPMFPRWSPDGRQIIFFLYLRSSGQRDLYLISAQGGQPKQLTHTPHNEAHPCFSRDGKWIFFSSDRTGEEQVWKMPAEGGDPVQVTREGGYVPTGSWDGEFVYYLKPPGSQTISDLWKVPAQGGRESRVLGPTYVNSPAIMEHGIYFMSPRKKEGVPLDYFDYATKEVKRIGLIPVVPGDLGISYGFTVSPDEHYFLYSYAAGTGTDLMLVENFR